MNVPCPPRLIEVDLPIKRIPAHARRGEAVKRFLVEEGAGRAGRFWKLARSMSALYPAGRDEKRGMDGVPVRKKGLGV